MKRFSTVVKKTLLDPIQLGPYNLKNRLVMAAMTRCRADPKTCVPNDLHVQYYSERAEDCGFVLTECSGVSRGGNSFPGGCGIWNDEQTEGWKRVCDAVHKVNGRIYLQIWHGGRASRKAVTGEVPVAPSAIPFRTPGKDGNPVNSETPLELTEDGIKKILDEFARGAQNALKAGFDGLELHGANGYLIDQFLRDCSNKRTDQYGGSIENRCRFPLMVIDALTSVFGADKVGIKATPVGRYQDMFDSNPIPLYTYLFNELSKRKISFVELGRGPDDLVGKSYYDVKELDQVPDTYKTFRPTFNGVLIGNSKFNFEEANKLIGDNQVDMVSFGRPYISNPDLAKRFQNGWPLAQPNMKTAYGGKHEGYTTYPKYQY